MLKFYEFLKIKTFIGENVAKKLRIQNIKYIFSLKPLVKHESKSIPRQTRNGPTWRWIKKNVKASSGRFDDKEARFPQRGCDGRANGSIFRSQRNWK